MVWCVVLRGRSVQVCDLAHEGQGGWTTTFYKAIFHREGDEHGDDQRRQLPGHPYPPERACPVGAAGTGYGHGK